MSPTRTCPECGLPLGGDALEGLCPTCLGKVALAESEADLPNGPLQALLNRALEFSNTEAQRGFLIGACGDDSTLLHLLQARLQSLTAAQATQKDLGPMPNMDGLSLPVTEKAGDRIGPYRLLQKIGEGGFGAVYVAEQLEPVQRRVALKVIKLGMDTRAVVARFEAERQALALMDHPHIAKVLDAGATDAGRPYFVMELVKGVPITEYCDQQRLTTKERLGLFIQVCQAIQHAHQKGIIHRDIKPSNILVGESDIGPVPKVIDFGIAKATDRKLTEKTIYTAVDQFIGTPAYVSPEQAEMSALDVDTRTDIYSLGVLLYELLTGRTPFDTKQLLESGLDEMRRTIREKDPPQPSTRLTTLGEKELEKVAAHHRADPAKFTSQLRGDLDWITMKALEKDRNRRYDTANGLAMDIQRYLNHDPVTAAAPSSLYRFKKLVRRNKALFAGVAAVLIVSLIGTVFSSYQAWRANDQAKRAEAARGEALLRLEEKRYEEGRVWMERAEGYLADKNYFYAKLMAARAVGFEGAGREGLPVGLQSDLPPLLPVESPEAIQARFILHGADYALVWRSPTFCHHTNFVTDVIVHPDGELLASASWDFSVRLWNIKSGLLMRELKADTESRVAAFSPNGAYLAVGYQGGGMQLWDVKTGSSKASFGQLGGSLLGVSFNSSSDAVATSAHGGWINVFDLQRGRTNKMVNSETGAVWRVAFTPDAKSLFVGFTSRAQDGTHAIQLWDVRTSRLQRSFAEPGPIVQLALSPKGDLVAVGHRSGLIRIRATDDGTVKHTMEGQFYINGLDFSPDGQRLISGDAEGSLKVWDVDSGKLLTRYTLGGGNVRGVQFTPDGKSIVSGHQDGRIRFLKLDGDPSNQSEEPWGHSSGLQSISFTSDGRRLVSADEYGNVLVWDLATSRVQANLGEGIMGLAHAAVDSSGNSVAIGYTTGEIGVWVATTRKRLWKAAGTHGVTELAFTSDDQFLVSGSSNGAVNVRLVTTGALVKEFAACAEPGSLHLAVHPAGHVVATGSEADETLRLWSISDGSLLREFTGHSRNITSVSISPRGDCIASGSWDGKVILWDPTTSGPRAELPGHVAGVWGLAFSPSGKMVATADQSGVLRLWDVATGQLLVRWQSSGLCRGLAFHPDESLLALASDDTTVQMWELVNAQVEGMLSEQPSDPVRALAYTRDGKLIAGGDNGRILTWDLATGQVAQEFSGYTNDVLALALSPDQGTVAAGERSGTLRLWDRASGKPNAVFSDQTNALCSLSYHPGGTLLAAGSEDCYVRVWDLARKELKAVLTNHCPDAARAVAFVHHGYALLSGDVAGTVMVWTNDITKPDNFGFLGVLPRCVAPSPVSPMMAIGCVDGRVHLLRVGRGFLYALPPHSLPAHSVAFSPDERLLASASEDGTVQLCDPSTAALLAQLKESSQAIYAVAFSPDGKVVAAGGADGLIRLWDVNYVVRGAPDYGSYMSSMRFDGRKLLSTVPLKQNNLYRREAVPIRSFSRKSAIDVLRSNLAAPALDRNLFQRFLRVGNLVSASFIVDQHSDNDAWRPERELLARAYRNEEQNARVRGAKNMAEHYATQAGKYAR